MKSIQQFLQALFVLPPRASEHRNAPARHVRLVRALNGAVQHGDERWSHLPAGLANGFAHFAERSRQAARERLM